MARHKSYESVQIESIEFRGHGITKPSGRVVFVEGTLPGEIVDVRVTRRKRDHAFGVPTHFHLQSPDRVEPFCSHFDACGGCTWQYLPYHQQLAFKEQFVGEVLSRLGAITEPAPLPIIGCTSDRHYRNKLEFSFSATRWLTESEIADGQQIDDRRALGLHVKGRFDRVIDIKTCYLQPEPSNEIRRAAREIAVEQGLSFYNPREHTGLLRSLVIRTTRDKEVLVMLVIGANEPSVAGAFLDLLRARVPAITSTHYLINETRNDDLSPHPAIHHTGTETITERCGPLSLTIHPKSFYQTNSEQAERLYGVVRDWIDIRADETLFDLYSGIGSIGLFLADRAAHVVGVEYGSEAVTRARENATRNGISNCEFHAGDVRALLRTLADRQTPPVVILDPPRAGVHPDVLEELIRMGPRQILYVSCNPATQARDLALLGRHYTVARMQPVDMFPQTLHIENVADLRKAVGAHA